LLNRHDRVVRTYLSPLDGQLHETSLEHGSPKIDPFQDRIPYRYRLRRNKERLFSLGQKEIVLPADAQ